MSAKNFPKQILLEKLLADNSSWLIKTWSSLASSRSFLQSWFWMRFVQGKAAAHISRYHLCHSTALQTSESGFLRNATVLNWTHLDLDTEYQSSTHGDSLDPRPHFTQGSGPGIFSIKAGEGGYHGDSLVPSRVVSKIKKNRPGNEATAGGRINESTVYPLKLCLLSMIRKNDLMASSILIQKPIYFAGLNKTLHSI